MFGYVQRGPALTRLYTDAAGRNRVLSAHRDDIATFREDQEVPHNGVFDATKFQPKQEGE